MVYFTLDQLLELHSNLIREFGGIEGIRDRGLVESALSQPFASFAGAELYPSMIDKAVALGFGLISNHGFLDGNKRIGFAAMEIVLRANGFRIQATTDELEVMTLDVANRRMNRIDMTTWICERIILLSK